MTIFGTRRRHFILFKKRKETFLGLPGIIQYFEICFGQSQSLDDDKKQSKPLLQPCQSLSWYVVELLLEVCTDWISPAAVLLALARNEAALLLAFKVTI